jgi:superfamily I DNA and RNA helicase
MNHSSKLDVVYGSTGLSAEVIATIKRKLEEAGIEGTFYIGYPVMASADSSTTIDALLVSQKPGLVAFHFSQKGEEFKAAQDKLCYALESNLGRHESLRRKRSLGVSVNVVSLFPESDAPATLDSEYPTASPSTVVDAFRDMHPLEDADVYRKLSAAIQRVTTIKPVKKRQNAAKTDSRGSVLRAIEREIANLDRWQKSAAIETPEGPQRIRGLAGSGKTVVLALKAAYLHAQHPDWKIAVTFHSRSLYQQFKDLVERFTLEHMGDKPDWNHLHIMHSWGSSSTEGIYSVGCAAANMAPTNYLCAKSRFGVARAFEGVCNELAAAMKGREFNVYDAVLIDEAQDLPKSFFRIVDAITKAPKRVVWAYDELQNLSEARMASTPELFGRDIQLTNTPGSPKQDILLPVCYRNTPWALTLAHALGFGLLRDKGMVQHFDEPSLWAEIGYAVEEGGLSDGCEVVLSRAQRSFPIFFTQLLTAKDAVQSFRFDTKDDQYAAIAAQIEANLKQDEIDPDDILVVLPDPITARDEFYALRRHLDGRGISSSLAGVTNDRDLFSQQGVVTVSGVYRAKGNEAPMVYVANADFCVAGHELIRLRNILFTCITRSRGWIRLCGVGEKMDALQKEIDGVVAKDFKLGFRIPTQAERDTMRTINRDRTAEEMSQIRKVEQGLEEALDLMQKGVISADTLPQLQAILEAARRKGSAH